MTEIGPENSGSARPADDGIDGRLAIIAHDTSESLELLRSLVALLLAKEAGHDGPRLEDLIGALVAQQRDMLAALRLLQADVTAIARRVLDDGDQDDLNGRHAAPRPC
jgi:hypothetical protein